MAGIAGGMTYQDEDSGSAYEESSNEDSLSSSENVQMVQQQARHESARSDTDTQIFEDAKEWAANFRPPAVEDIRTPPRHRSRKRRAQKPPSELRYRRLRPYYDNGYRELLNTEVHDAAYGETPRESLEPTQIGSSIWTVAEKDLLFSSLPRHGIDNARGIAAYVGTKSEPEVQEFLYLLQANIVERKKRSRRDFMLADLPAAAEISEECCLVLERAGDALAGRQEMAEEKLEASKWSDIWLIDEQVSRLIERRRREEGGEEALDAVLPAGNLFISKNWLELSRRVFMNPGHPRAEDNWETLAELDESPAIRATALEDFHSLAVNITKKLLSTTLFCTMSRLRSGNYHYVKISEVTADDVEAAVNILGIKGNSEQFWLGCAKRNNLEVVDDGEDIEETEASALTHEDVEEELRSLRRSRSQSRSSRHEYSRASSQASMREVIGYSSPSEVDFEDVQDFYSDSSVADETEPLVQHDSPEFTDPESPTVLATNKTTRIQDRKVAERAQDAYAEAIDMQASWKEEARLWTLIEQEPPFEVEPESRELERPLAIRDDIEDGRRWREHSEYWGTWETMRTPVPSSAFNRNRERQSRRAKARAKGSLPRPADRADGHPALDEELKPANEHDDSEGHPERKTIRARTRLKARD